MSSPSEKTRASSAVAASSFCHSAAASMPDASENESSDD